MQDQNGQVAEYKNMNIRACESVGTLLKTSVLYLNIICREIPSKII